MTATKAKPPKKATVKRELILRHPFLQMRHLGTQEGHARDLAEAIKKKEKVPPIKVVQCVHPETPDLEGIYVVDGWHTLAGYEANGAKEVPVILTRGTWDDAVLAAAAANAEHNSLKRTRDDKRKAVERLVEHFPKWSARRIADHCKVSPTVAAEVKQEQAAEEDEVEEKVVENKAGKKQTVKKPVKKPKKTQPNPGDWRYIELKDLLNTDYRVFDALAEKGVYNAGQFMRAVKDGETFGFNAEFLKQLLGEVENVIPEGEEALTDSEAGTTGKDGQGGLVFDWQRWHAAVGVVIRGVDAFYKNHEASNSAEHKALLNKAGTFVAEFKKEYKRLAKEEPPAA